MGKASWELQHCNKMLSFPNFGWQFLLPFLQWWKKIKKSCQKIREPQWQCCTFALERLNTHRLATDVRHLSSLRVLLHVVTRKMRKKHPLPPPPFKVTIRMRLSKEKTEGEWNGKRLTFVLWQIYIHQKGTLFVQYRNSSNSCWSMIILERNCPLP